MFKLVAYGGCSLVLNHNFWAYSLAERKKSSLTLSSTWWPFNLNLKVPLPSATFFLRDSKLWANTKLFTSFTKFSFSVFRDPNFSYSFWSSKVILGTQMKIFNTSFSFSGLAYSVSATLTAWDYLALAFKNGTLTEV